MELITKSFFPPEELEVLNQNIYELSDFFQGSGTAIVSRVVSKKGKVKIKMKVTDGDAQMEFVAVGKNSLECFNKIKAQTNKILQQLSDEVISNAERIHSINELLKNSKIH